MNEVDYQVALQVRLGSRRLPAKALLGLGNTLDSTSDGEPQATVLDWVLYHLRQSLRVTRFVLLCPLADRARLEPFAQRHGFYLFAGAEEDVLQRFQQGLRAYPAGYCFRLTGDNPLVHGALLDCMLHRLEQHRQRTGRTADYYWWDGLPYGLATELFRSEALLSLQRDPWKNLLEPEDCEHVTRFLYRHPESFAVLREDIAAIWGPQFQGLGELRLTLDTAEDYQFLSQLFVTLQQQGLLPSAGPLEITEMPGKNSASTLPGPLSGLSPDSDKEAAERQLRRFLLAVRGHYLQ